MDSTNQCIKLIQESLSCAICKDPFKTPVIVTQCSHNFCSICIRRYFTIKQECPICGKDASQGNLYPNRILESLLQRFDELRTILETCMYEVRKSAILQYKIDHEKHESVCEDKNIPQVSHVEVSIPESPPNRSTNPSIVETGVATTTNDSDCEIIEGTPEFSLGLKEFCTQSEGFTLPSQGFSIGVTQSNESSKEMFAVMSESLVCAQHSNNNPLGDSSAVLLSPDTSQDLSLEPPPPTAPLPIAETMADCPVCGLQVSCAKINKHLDNCLAREEKKKCLRQNTPKRQKRNNPPITKLAYNLLNLKELRKKLKEIGLSTQGNKEEMTTRHKEFLAKYHAEQDKIKPRNMTILLEELEREENNQKQCINKQKESTRKRNLFGQRKRHLQSNAESYKKLIEIASKSMPPKTKSYRATEAIPELNHTECKEKPSTSAEVKMNEGNCISQLAISSNSNLVHSPEANNKEKGGSSPDLYVGATPSEVIAPSRSMRAAVEADSQANEIRQFIDASLT